MGYSFSEKALLPLCRDGAQLSPCLARPQSRGEASQMRHHGFDQLRCQGYAEQHRLVRAGLRIGSAPGSPVSRCWRSVSASLKPSVMDSRASSQLRVFAKIGPRHHRWQCLSLPLRATHLAAYGEPLRHTGQDAPPNASPVGSKVDDNSVIRLQTALNRGTEARSLRFANSHFLSVTSTWVR